MGDKLLFDEGIWTIHGKYSGGAWLYTCEVCHCLVRESRLDDHIRYHADRNELPS